MTQPKKTGAQDSVQSNEAEIDVIRVGRDAVVDSAEDPPLSNNQESNSAQVERDTAANPATFQPQSLPQNISQGSTNVEREEHPTSMDQHAQ
jgi:hypothetical protein